jgi:hypothetical protein
VIPLEVAPLLPAAIDTILLREGVILEAIRAPGFDIEAHNTAVGDSAEIH